MKIKKIVAGFYLVFLVVGTICLFNGTGLLVAFGSTTGVYLVLLTIGWAFDQLA